MNKPIGEHEEMQTTEVQHGIHHMHPEQGDKIVQTHIDDYKEHGGHEGHEMHGGHQGHGEHEGHVDHRGHEQMFRRKFWVSLLLSIPVLIFSPSIQTWLGYSLPDFPGSNWITLIFAVIVFLYGGLPFLQMAVPEIKNR